MSTSADWEQYRAFLAVLETGSLSAAARALGLTQPTVRSRIEMLETRLNARLFTRTPNGLQPTELALSLEDHVRAMALAAEAFDRSASASAYEVAGVVRISASEIIAVEVLPAILAPLRVLHPGLVFALSPSNRNEDLLRREADIAIRMARPVQEGLVAQRIGSVALGLFARRDYLDQWGAPEDLESLPEHGLIGVEHDNVTLRGFREKGFSLPFSDFSVRADSDLAQLAAIRAGLGIGVCQKPLARRDPALTHILPNAFSYDLECWVVTHEDLRNTRRIRVTFDHIATEMQAYIRS